MNKSTVQSEKAPLPIGPYSQAVRTGNLLFISGQVALDTAGSLHTASIEDETRQVMTNLQEILKAAGADFSHVVKTTIFLSDMNDFARVNEVYGSYFKSQPPARETVQVSRLPKDVHVEISCIATME